jgi:hypothetical protein
MKGILVRVAGLYVGWALITHVLERNGAIECKCRPDCWCKRPGLSLFRWTLPVGHRSPS